MAREPISEPFWTWEHTIVDLATIAAGAAKAFPLKVDAAREQGWRGIKMRWFMEFTGKVINLGPIVWGLSYGLTNVQIASSQDSDPQIDVEVDMEQVRRNLVPLGIIPKRATQSGELAGTTRYLTEQPFRQKKMISWDVPEGSDILTFYHVPSGGVSITGNTLVELTVGLYGGWLSD